MPKAEIREFRSTRKRTCTLVAGLSEDEMAERPGPDRWSAGELVDHLLRTEVLWRREVEELVRLERSKRQPYLSRLVADFPIPVVGRLPAPLVGLISVPMTIFNAFFPTRLFLSLLRYRGIPAKAPPAIAPRQGRSAEELRRELESEAEATAAVFEDNDDLRFHRMIYQHPLLGLVDAVDLVRVITVHEKRHQDQLIEILEKIGVRGKA